MNIKSKLILICLFVIGLASLLTGQAQKTQVAAWGHNGDVIQSRGFTPVLNELTGECNFTMFFVLNAGKRYDLQLSNDCGETWFHAYDIPKGNYYSYTYIPGGLAPRVIEDTE